MKNMHLDPDFNHLTYGDRNQRGNRLRILEAGDVIIFYAGLWDTRPARELVYAIIGKFEVERWTLAANVSPGDWDKNAHSRKILDADADDIIVYGRPGASGRLERCIPIGEWRERAYRVRKDLLEEWGGLSITNGYIQRSVYLPCFLDPERFLKWFKRQNPKLIQRNN